MNGKLSDLGEVTCGVLQRSCLGPLLFVIYVNDLPLSIKHSQVNMNVAKQIALLLEVGKSLRIFNVH